MDEIKLQYLWDSFKSPGLESPHNSWNSFNNHYINVCKCLELHKNEPSKPQTNAYQKTVLYIPLFFSQLTHKHLQTL